MSRFLIVMLVAMLSGCSTIYDMLGQSASVMADLKEQYCDETDQAARDAFRDAYNAEMDERGLPHDQINCPP